MKKTFCAFILLVSQSAIAQQEKHHLKLNIEIPIQMGIGYEYHILDKVSLYGQLGFLQEPNSSLALSLMESLGTDQLTLDLIENAFNSGFISEIGSNYHFSKYYIGLFYQTGHLKGENTSAELVETILGIELPARRPGILLEDELTLKTRISQLGFQIGRRFYLNKGYLFTELGFSINVGSKSSLESSDRNVSAGSKQLDIYLKEVYESYAYIPSLSFGYVYAF